MMEDSVRVRLYLRSARDHLSRAEYRGLARKLASVISSESVAIVVEKDLAGLPPLADAKRRPPIRTAAESDVHSLVGSDQAEDVEADELWERRLRRHILASLGARGCFVADAVDGTPSFMQYLFTAADNHRLRAEFGGLFPTLGPDEAMVEFLYVLPASRNPGLIVNCLLQVADEARKDGAVSVISFIDATNKGALFVNHLAGFHARSTRRTTRRWFRKSYRFEPWPEGLSRSLSDLASGNTTLT
jgi:hypothetical protein